MPKVYRCFTEKMAGFDVDAREVFHDLKSNLQIDTLTQVRIFCRYDVQGIDEKVYALARHNVFSEPMVDRCYDETLPELSGWRVFGGINCNIPHSESPYKHSSGLDKRCAAY